MNLNKALILSFCFLILLVVVTAIHFKHPKNKPDQFIFLDNSEMLMVHVRCAPEIVRNYETVSHVYGTKNTLFFRNKLAKYNYRNIPADSLLTPIYDGEQKSYFAWVNNKEEIDMVFIPYRDNVQLTRNYFLEVKRIIQMIGVK